MHNVWRLQATRVHDEHFWRVNLVSWHLRKECLEHYFQAELGSSDLPAFTDAQVRQVRGAQKAGEDSLTDGGKVFRELVPGAN